MTTGRKLRSVILLGVLAAAIALCCGNIRIDNNKFVRIADTVIQGLSVEQKIGQMLMPAIPGKAMTPALDNMLQRYKPGGIILFGFNLGSAANVKELTASIQRASMKYSGLPAFISTDQEGGRVKRLTAGVTQFPGNMAAGAVNDKKLTYKWGKTLGLQLRSLGVNMNLAPSLDINDNPANPVINTRSFGGDIDTVSAMGVAYIKGLRDAGCLPAGKHFPGLGNSSVDNHLKLSVMDCDISRLEAVELIPFQRAIDAGLDCIMTTHVAFPNILGSREAVTVSSFFITELLKNKMKFSGLVITDDMEMGGLRNETDIGHAAVSAVEAGSDIVLLSSWGKSLNEIFNSLTESVKSGRLSEERINASVRKIIAAKLKYGIAAYSEGSVICREFVPSKKEEKFAADAESLNREISQKAVSCIGDASLLSPPSETVRIFISSSRDFVRFISADENDMVLAGLGYLPAAISKLSPEAQLIVYAETYSPGSDFTAKIKRACGNRAVSIVAAVSGNPFPIIGGDMPDTLLMSFSNTPASLEFLAKACSGEFKPAMENRLTPKLLP